jgi:hypothetical protein
LPGRMKIIKVQYGSPGVQRKIAIGDHRQKEEV